MDHLTTPASKFNAAQLLARIRTSNGTTPSHQSQKEVKQDHTPVSIVPNLWDNNAITSTPFHPSSSSSSSKPPPPPSPSSTILAYQRESKKEIQRLQQQITNLTKQNEALNYEKRGLVVENVEKNRKANDSMAKLRGKRFLLFFSNSFFTCLSTRLALSPHYIVTLFSLGCHARKTHTSTIIHMR